MGFLEGLDSLLKKWRGLTSGQILDALGTLEAAIAEVPAKAQGLVKLFVRDMKQLPDSPDFGRWLDMLNELVSRGAPVTDGYIIDSAPSDRRTEVQMGTEYKRMPMVSDAAAARGEDVVAMYTRLKGGNPDKIVIRDAEPSAPAAPAAAAPAKMPETAAEWADALLVFLEEMQAALKKGGKKTVSAAASTAGKSIGSDPILSA